jgi:hypothetical protein
MVDLADQPDDMRDFLSRFHELQAERGLLPNPNEVELCVVDGKPIQVTIFQGSGFCSDQCRKAAGNDISSVGTFMFVTTTERKKIMKGREPKKPKKTTTKGRVFISNG